MSDTPTPTAPRRNWLIGAVGLAALLAGGGAWYARQRVTARAGADSGLPADFWQRRVERPQGGDLAFADLRGRPLLVNFWASWCPPCVREMPLLDRFAREFGPRGWQVLGLAVDNAAPVQAFLARTPVGFPVAVTGFAGADLSRELGNPSGALPYSVAIDAAGHLRFTRLGEIDWAELTRWAQQITA